MNRSTLRILLVIVMAVMLGAAAIGAFCWWKMTKLKGELLAGLEKATGAQVQVSSLDLDLWHGELHAAGITLINTRSSAPWEKAAIAQATVRFNFLDVFAPTLPVNVEVSSWNVLLSDHASVPETTISNSPGSSAPDTTSAPTKVRIKVTRLSAHDGSVEFDQTNRPPVIIHGVAFEATESSAGIWTTEVQATSVKAGSLEAGVSSVQIRGESEKVTFDHLRMACGTGFITGEGESSVVDKHLYKATFKAAEVPVTMFVAVEWQMKLSGQVTGNLTCSGDDDSYSAVGKLSLNHAKFNIIPWLGKATVLVGLPDITDVEVDKATADFTWKEHKLELTNIDVQKNEVTRIAGTADIDAMGQIDAKLKLGLPSTVTAKWPELQTKVFSVQLEDFNWTDVHLTGPPDHLQEDLSPRLVALGMQQGNSLIDQATQKAADIYHSLMGK